MIMHGNFSHKQLLLNTLQKSSTAGANPLPLKCLLPALRWGSHAPNWRPTLSERPLTPVLARTILRPEREERERFCYPRGRAPIDIMAVSGELFLIDGPDLRLEECLPMLRQAGFACAYAPGVDELAWENLAQRQPDVILVSTSLAGGPHGPPFAQIRAHCQAPVLVVAYMRSLTVTIDWFRSGASDLLPAPFQDHVLLQRVTELLHAPAETLAEPLPAYHNEAEAEAHGPELLQPQDFACGVLCFDATGALQSANAIALQLLEQKTLEGLQATLSHHIPDWAPINLEHRAITPSEWPVRAALSKQTPQRAVLGLSLGTGERRWLAFEAQPTTTNGTPNGAVLTLHDVSKLVHIAQHAH